MVFVSFGGLFILNMDKKVYLCAIFEFMEEIHINKEHAVEAYASMSAIDFVVFVTDFYLEELGGALTAENMLRLNTHQHTLLAYRYVLDEVMEGGFIQLIENGYAPYVLEGPFPYAVKHMWGRKDFSKLLYKVKKAYHENMDAFAKEKTEEEFMAMYEELEDLNDLGDDFLDDFQEKETPAIARIVMDNLEQF